MPRRSWNCMSLNLNWTVLRCEFVLVYSQDRRQKNNAIWMRSARHWERGVVVAAAAALTTSPRGIAFSRLDGGSW